MVNPKLPHADEYAALGRALRTLRKRVGLTQIQAAEQIGIRSTFVSQIERGQRGMRWHTLTAHLRAYHADLRTLGEAIERAEAE
jgi:transcriptional regulator with XRE-family HTH domain